MRKTLFIILVTISFLPKSAVSQYRITLDSLNTYRYYDVDTYAGQYAYLIDYPISANIDTLFIDDKMSIPLKAYLNFLPYTKCRVLIIAQHHSNKPANTSKEYIIGSRHPVDSSTNIDSRFFSYKELLPYKLNDDSLLIYYTEGMGSSCCPRDPNYDMQPLDGFIEQFENTYKIKIGMRYDRSEGKEGEHTDYLTLEGLTPLQKIKFIDERRWSLIPNKQLKSFGIAYTIYMPVVIAKKYVAQVITIPRIIK